MVRKAHISDATYVEAARLIGDTVYAICGAEIEGREPTEKDEAERCEECARIFEVATGQPAPELPRKGEK